MEETIYRLHYRGQLKENTDETKLSESIECCVRNIREAQRKGKILTAALYRAGDMLFFYYEALGSALPVMEPYAMGDGGDGCECEVLAESGEDVQTTCIRPEELLEPLSTLLMPWPGQKRSRLWAYMYHIYYHQKPESKTEWKRAAAPEKRRGRIAFLRSDKLFSYTYFHKAIVDEGLLKGDKYQSIALHENILFSYFEEPKQMRNVKNAERESEVIKEWMAVDPESHFIHMREGNGENFMFLPALFALGVEDLDD